MSRYHRVSKTNLKYLSFSYKVEILYFYQLRQVQERGGTDEYLDMVIEILNKFYGRE